MISDFGFRISDFSVSGSFRLADHSGDIDTKWWRALKDPPTKGAKKPVGGSFRARHHDDPVPPEAQREHGARGRNFEIRNSKFEIPIWAAAH